MSKLTNTQSTALSLLQGGACFRYGLESGWQGREKFQWSLLPRKGSAQKIKGFGGACFRALEAAGFEFDCDYSGGSTYARYYSLKGGN